MKSRLFILTKFLWEKQSHGAACQGAFWGGDGGAREYLGVDVGDGAVPLESQCRVLGVE